MFRNNTNTKKYSFKEHLMIQKKNFQRTIYNEKQTIIIKELEKHCLSIIINPWKTVKHPSHKAIKLKIFYGISAQFRSTPLRYAKLPRIGLAFRLLYINNLSVSTEIFNSIKNREAICQVKRSQPLPNSQRPIWRRPSKPERAKRSAVSDVER